MEIRNRHAVLITPYIPICHGTDNEKRAWQHLQGLKINQRSVSVILLNWQPSRSPEHIKNLISQCTSLTLARCEHMRFASVTELALELFKTLFTQTSPVLLSTNTLKRLAALYRQIKPDLTFCFCQQSGVAWQQLNALPEFKSHPVILDLNALAKRPNHNEFYLTRRYHSFVWSVKDYLVKWIYQHQERQLAQLANRVLVKSVNEKRQLKPFIKHNKINVLPSAVNLHKKEKKSSDITHILFVTNFNHWSNLQALDLLTKDILPSISQHYEGKLQLDIIGQPSKAQAQLLLTNPSVKVWNESDQLHYLYQRATLAICPVQYNYNCDSQIIAAMSYGLPVISTRSAAQALEVTHAKNILFAESVIEFQQLCIKVIRDDICSTTIGENGHYLVKQHYSDYRFQHSLSKLIELTV